MLHAEGVLRQASRRHHGGVHNWKDICSASALGAPEWQGVPACCMRLDSVMLCLEYIFEHKLCAGLHTRTRLFVWLCQSLCE